MKQSITANTHSSVPAPGPGPLAPASASDTAVQSRLEMSRSRDRLVMAMMALVAVAFSSGLALQFGVPAITAVLAGAGLWGLLTSLHRMKAKAEQIDRLKSEVQRLEGEIAQVKGLAPGARAVPSSQPAIASPAAPARPGSPDKQADTRPSEPAFATAPGPQGPGLQGPGLQGPGLQGIDSTVHKLAADARWEQPQMAPKSRLVKPEPGIVAPPPVVPPVAAVRPAVPAVSTPFGFETSTSLPNPLQDAWAFRPKEAVAGGMERSPGVEPLPPAVAPPRLHASIDSELEMVQRKIKALADEVNSAEASRMQNAGLDAGAMQQSAIDHSVGALKAASQSMRERNVAVAQPQPQLQPPPRVQDTARFPSAELLIPATAQRIAVSLPEPEQNNHDRDYAAVLVPAATRLPEPLQQPQHHAVAAAPIPAPVPAPTAPDARIAAIAHAIHIGNMDVYFAPIVGLQDQAVRHYEVSVRLKTPSGMLIENAEDVVELAASDIAGLFDCARLSRSALFAGRLEALRKPGSVMSSVTGQAITDVRFLETFARLYEERQSIAAQLVLTFRQSDVAHFSAPAWQALDDMNAFGFRFAIDRVEHLDIDFAALAQRGFAFVKLPARAFLDGLPVANGMVPASDICRHLAATGLTLVAEAIDDEALRACVFGFGTLLGQGQLFGGARPINLEHAQAGRTAAA